LLPTRPRSLVGLGRCSVETDPPLPPLPPLSLSLPSRWCVAAATKETDLIITETDDPLNEALLKQLECTKEKEALTKEREALTREKEALTKERDELAKDKHALTMEMEVQLAAFTKEKGALAKQLAAAISTCAALKNSTDRSVEIHAAGAYPRAISTSQAAAVGGSMRRHTHATRP
jgi:hypothetical protein